MGGLVKWAVPSQNLSDDLSDEISEKPEGIHTVKVHEYVKGKMDLTPIKNKFPIQDKKYKEIRDSRLSYALIKSLQGGRMEPKEGLIEKHNKFMPSSCKVKLKIKTETFDDNIKEEPLESDLPQYNFVQKMEVKNEFDDLNDELTNNQDFSEDHIYRPEHICQKCGKKFTLKKYLERHDRLVHKTNLRHMCNVCGKKFALTKNLDIHMYVHEKNQTKEGGMESNLVMKRRDLIYRCSIRSCLTRATKGVYRFPENPNRLKVWTEACGLKSANIKKETRICWKHFNKSDFINDISEKDAHEFGIGELVKWAVPSQNLCNDLNEKKYGVREKHCCLNSCPTKSKKGFYIIPENPSRRKAWIEACNWPSDISKNSRICWKHFKKSDFVNEMDENDAYELGMGALVRTAVPSQNLSDDLGDLDQEKLYQTTRDEFRNIKKSSFSSISKVNSDFSQDNSEKTSDIVIKQELDMTAEYSDEDQTKEDWIEANLADENYLAICETELKYEETESTIERVITIE